MLVASGRELIHEQLVHQALGLLIDFVDEALLQLTVEWGAFLVHQAIGGDVFHTECQRGVDVLLPVSERLLGETVHEVDADVGDACLTKSFDSLRHLCRCVATVEEA